MGIDMISDYFDERRSAGLMIDRQTQYAIGPRYGIRATLGEGFLLPDGVVEYVIVDARPRIPINVHRWRTFAAALAAYKDLET